MSRTKAVILWLSLGVMGGTLQAQQQAMVSTTPASVTFQFDRPGVQVPRYSFEVHEDGTVLYHAEEVIAAPPDGPVVTKSIDRRLHISPATVSTIFKTARSLDHFNLTCESTVKNVAKTGTKTLSYRGSDGKGSDGAGQCIYNFSENKNVVALTELFQSLAYTQDEGRRLDFLHRFDRLGLDAETISLEKAVADHSAIEIGTISASLQSLVDDTAIMQRVRQRAMRMLEQAKQAE